MDISEKAAYVKGLFDGMELDMNDKQNKILKALIDVVNDIAEEVSQLDQCYDDVCDQIDALDCKNVEWKRLDDKKSSCVNVKLEADMKDKADWPRQMEWMYKTLMELHKIVKPHYGAIRGIK